MLISASIVITPRRSRLCIVCGKYIHAAHVRLYGSAERGDPPYVCRIHPECATRDVLVKLQAVAQHCVKPSADHASVIARVATAVQQTPAAELLTTRADEPVEQSQPADAGSSQTC